MPRKHTVRDFQPNSTYHIYNQGANNYAIFQDEQDFGQFLQYLEDYLTPPPDKESLKITVEFKGKKLTGVPRQPNNYFGDLQLRGYCLTPLDFHLILYQDPDHSIAKFMQSLTTRYSMYFNKRHGRTGSPFRSKYKAIQIENEADLLHLSRYIHRKSWHGETRSSYPDYLDQTQTDWLDTQFISEFFVSTETPVKPAEYLKQFTEDDRLDSIQELGELRLDE